jgi:16S rRNA (guanine966-N2)-methyltransferase
MRIVSGKWRGRKLSMPIRFAEDIHLRPTTDRVREAVFSILGGRVTDAPVVDLCCGSGSLGLEALSRGARHCLFVDTSGDVLKGVQRNLDLFEAPGDCYTLLRRDALKVLKRLPAGNRGMIIFSDPPYGGSLAAEIWKACLAQTSADRISILCLEHEAGLELDSPPDGWQLDRRKYGISHLSILERLP